MLIVCGPNMKISAKDGGYAAGRDIIINNYSGMVLSAEEQLLIKLLRDQDREGKIMREIIAQLIAQKDNPKPSST